MSSRLIKAVSGIIIVLTFLIFPVSPAIAQGEAIILTPTPVEVVSGNSFTVTLQISDIPAPGMNAYNFKITYTPGVIEFGTTAGDHEWPDPDYGTPMVLNVDNAAGFISFNDVFATTPAPSGNITLVVLHGTATSAASATTALHFEKAAIKDYDGAPIPATVTDGEVKVWVAPVASFTWDYTDANSTGTLDAGEVIQFTDTSTNTPTSWSWDFDDTNSSVAQNPTHNYNTADTYSVGLTVTNTAGSDGTSDSVTVEPNSLDTVTVSPASPTVLVGGSTTFAANGYDVFGNPIPGIAWSWEVTNATAGSIVAGTGEFTAGTTAGTYTDVIKATGTYKDATVSGCASVEVVSVMAEIGMSKGLDIADIVLVSAGIVRIYDPSTGDPVAVPGGLGGYAAGVTYSGSQIEILDVRGGDAPFDATPTVVIDKPGGTANFEAAQSVSEPQAPITVANMVVRLVGSTMEEAELQLSFSEIADSDGTLIPQDGPVSEFFRRGDALVDGEVNISDALFIAQYLVGSRSLGPGVGLVHPVNAASVMHDGSGDEINISDVLYICQYLAEVRDEYFVMTP